MKTSEFIEIMENYGYTVRRSYGIIYIGLKGRTIMEVFENKFGRISTTWKAFNELEQHEQETIIEKAFKYIMTPLEEREEPKRYYLRLPNSCDSNLTYLNYDTWNELFSFMGMMQNKKWQTQFTQEEIDNLPEQAFIQTLIQEEVDED